VRLVSIVGARPQFIKIAPLLRSFERQNGVGDEYVENIIVHTGQHYDTGMSEIFFEELSIPRPTVNLGIGSGPHGRQTGQMMEKIEEVLVQMTPSMALVYGDTNSTVAGALAAAKLNIPIAHVEAGVRSFNRYMPEEINRIVVDHISELLLAPTPTAMENLNREGVFDRAVLTGDIMYDSVLFNRKLAEKHSDVLESLGLEANSYGVVTVHRAENTENANRLEKLLKTFNDIAGSTLRLVFPMHPRTAELLPSKFPSWSPHPRLQIIEPIGCLDMLCLVNNARVILTDSGGLQKEAFFLGCPCITLREETEWVETIQGGGNILTGVDPEMIRTAVSDLGSRPNNNGSGSQAEASQFGDGRAADKIREIILGFHSWGQRREK